jgi:F-box and WD-40 domain protein 1/11
MGPAALRQAIYQNPQIIQFTRLQSAILAEPDETARQQMRAIVQHAILRHQTLLMQYQMAHPNAPPGAAISHSSAMLAMSGMQGSAQHGAAMPFAQMQGIPQALAHTQGQSQSQSGPSLHHATVQDQPEEEDDDTPVILVPGPAATASSNPAQAAAAAQTAQAAATAQAHQQAQAAATQAHQAALANAMGGAQAHGNANGNNTNMARVFKLQFDARRIICCSQMPVIVGWDFANGDERIEEASGFFGVVE